MNIQTMRLKRGATAKATAALVKGGEIVIDTTTAEILVGTSSGEDTAVPVAIKVKTANLLGTLATNQLPAFTLSMMPAEVQSLIGSIEECGEWNATTGLITVKNADCPAAVPAVGEALPAAAIGNKGWAFYVSTAGTTALDGITEWQVSDLIVSNGAKWRKIDNTAETTYDCGEIV